MDQPQTPQEALRHATEAMHQAHAAVSVAASEAAAEHPSASEQEEDQ